MNAARHARSSAPCAVVGLLASIGMAVLAWTDDHEQANIPRAVPANAIDPEATPSIQPFYDARSGSRGAQASQRHRPRPRDFASQRPDRFDRLPVTRRTTPPIPSSIPRTEHVECDVEGFATKSGQRLSDHIGAMTYHCINELFSDAPLRIRTAAFSMRNMIDISQATIRLMDAYEGRNTSHLYSKHYLYLRTGYYNHYGIAEEMDWADQADVETVTEAVVDAIDAFVEHDHYLDLTDTHSETAWEIFSMFAGGGYFLPYMAHYLPAFKRWLEAFGRAHVERYEVGAATHLIFSSMYEAHLSSSFVAAATEDADLIATLRNFALRDYMLGTDAEYLIGNAGLNLANFVQYESAPVHADVVAGIKTYFERYSREEHFGIWLEAARIVLYHGYCGEFGICGFDRELEAQVLPVAHSCSEVDVHIRAEDLTEADLGLACRSMAETGDRFHALLNTGRQPVADDHNEHLEVIVFANSDSYETYSNLFFGNDTDNGGIYYEGDPADQNNVAQFFAYVADWLPERRVWNLEHEYVHYLDGRFNVHGGFFLEYNVLWWIEGLAEYVSRRNDNPDAIELAARPDFGLDELFPTTYDHGENRVYRWSYLAVRFLFERYPEHVGRIVGNLRAACFAEHERYLEAAIGAALNDEWFDWLRSVTTRSAFTTDRGVASYQATDCGINDGSDTDDGSDADDGSDLDDGPDYDDSWTATIHPMQVELLGLGESTTVDIAAFFRGFGADAVFSVSSSAPDIVEASLDGGVLTLVAVSEGEAVVAMAASEGGRSAARTLAVSVMADCPAYVCRNWTDGWRLEILLNPP